MVMLSPGDNVITHAWRQSDTARHTKRCLRSVNDAAASTARGLDRQHAVDHLAGEAQVIRRVAHLLELLAADVLGNLLVGGKEIDQRLAARRRLAADVVDEIVRALA